jgi:hypothetical protein
MLICVSPNGAPDPIYLSAEDVTCIKGPMKTNQVLGPGKNNQVEWLVEYWMREGVRHTIRYDSQEVGTTHVALIRSAHP